MKLVMAKLVVKELVYLSNVLMKRLSLITANQEKICIDFKIEACYYVTYGTDFLIHKNIHHCTKNEVSH